MKRNIRASFTARRQGALRCIGLPAIAGLLLLSVSLLQAATPPNPAVELRFPEGPSGSGGASVTTANTGDLSGVATFATDDFTDLSGYPMFTNVMPTGTYAPSANSYALDMGPVYGTNFGRAVDLQTTASPPGDGTLGAFNQLTICGWLNCRFLPKNSRIAYALEFAGGLGFELATHEYGPLALGINESAGLGTMSVTKITQDPNVGNDNWIYFAATYDPSLSENQLKYYFGKPDQLAYLDSAYTYTGGDPSSSLIQYTGPFTVGNFGMNDGARDNMGNYEPIQMFQGLLDEIKVYNAAFTIDEVQQAQINAAVTPAAASVLTPPASISVPAGQNATFTVRATGSGSVTYQWYTSANNGATWSPAAGADSSSFTLASVSLTDNGKWVRVGVSNTIDGVLSTSAVLTVLPAKPQILQLSFTEGTGKLTTNACAYWGMEQILTTTPETLSCFTNLVPSGPWAPNTNFNQYSLFVGGSGSPSPRGVDIITSNRLSGGIEANWVGTFNQFTICGWISIFQTGGRNAGGLGNAILHCSDASAAQPNGIELVYKPPAGSSGLLQYNGQLACLINDDADWDTLTGTYNIMSTGTVMGNTNLLDPTNWVFFAVTWDGPNTNLTYFFGNGWQSATQDVSRVSVNRFGEPQTNIVNTGPMCVGGYNASGGSSRSNTGNTSAGWVRGCLDEINMFNRVLTLPEIQQVQVGGTVPPLMGVSAASANTTVSWGPKTAPQMEYQLQSRTNLSSAAWSDVTSTPADSGNTRSVTLPTTNATKFFRLRSK